MEQLWKLSCTNTGMKVTTVVDTTAVSVYQVSDPGPGAASITVRNLTMIL